MKIGAFCELYDISRDTVRFYVKNGLLAPKVQGSRMDFSQKDQEDLDFIMKLKGMKFSLEEIYGISESTGNRRRTACDDLGGAVHLYDRLRTD